MLTATLSFPTLMLAPEGGRAAEADVTLVERTGPDSLRLHLRFGDGIEVALPVEGTAASREMFGDRCLVELIVKAAECNETPVVDLTSNSN